MKLLTRDQFREAVFARDGGVCVFCSDPAKDAHHILERRLWPDGGYYLGNGVSVCPAHHLACERTTISVREVLAACGIEKRIIPPHLYEDHEYDKWGNVILEDGTRTAGELFYDENVQKALAEGGVLKLFGSARTKYPRTYHLPWSPGLNADDRKMENLDALLGQEVMITEKMDGENTTFSRDYIHARSLDGRNHPSQAWVKNFWAQIRSEIPEGMRICGENLFAEHSIHYPDLPSYFMGFSVWQGNTCLSWNDTVEWFELLGIKSVPALAGGIFEGERTDRLLQSLLVGPTGDGLGRPREREGYVVRVARSFELREFSRVVGKYVRANHVQTNKHWFYGQSIVSNGLRR